MTKRIAILFACGATLGTVGLHAQITGSNVTVLSNARTESGQDIDSAGLAGWALHPKITWATTRDDPGINPFLAAEIYMMNPDLTGEERITFTENAANFFPVLSPTGKRMVFDSNRLRGGGRINTSDLFLMNPDGSDQTHLVRGSSATWSPDGHRISYHASASGIGVPIRANPGSATSDSDIFALSVDEFLEVGEAPINLTNSPDYIDDDPDWSPDGTQIVFTRHGVKDPHNNSFTAEILVMNADGSGLTQLTLNAEEERGPAWSPDGGRIAYACRRGDPPTPGGVPTFEICVMNADGTSQVQLTFNSVPDFTPTWSLDGTQIVFHREVGGREQLFRMNADGTVVTQITDSEGRNLLASQGVVKVAGLQGNGAQ
jgi:TolB protein